MIRRLGVVVIAAVVAGVLAAAPVAAQDGEGSGAAASTVRIQARLVESGKVEFGLQLDGDREWLPQARLFPYATAAVGNWLFASPYTLSDATVVRIQARRVASGKVEFGLQLDGDEVWLPQARLFPYATATVGNWLFASPYTVATAATPTASQDTPDPSGGTVTDGVYTPNDRTGGVEVWGVVPWDADFLAGWNEKSDFLDACGFHEREYEQCDNPADTEILHQLDTELYQCEVNRNTWMCEGFSVIDQEFWDGQLACPEGWSITYYPRDECYHPEHPLYRAWRGRHEPPRVNQ